MGLAPIGVFDSGLGGLTVVKALRARFPNEDFLYLGDTARVPYGSRSPATVAAYALACAKHLEGEGIRGLVVACNTVSAVALDALRVGLSVPVLGVIEPGARAAASATRSGRIGLIATAATVASEAYPRAVQALLPKAQVIAKATPLLVPLVEEGWIDGEVPLLVLERYLASLVEADLDVLLLGCTHYPLLAECAGEALRRLGAPSIQIVDGAAATAVEAGSVFELAAAARGAGSLTVQVTDVPYQFEVLATRILGAPVGKLNVEQIHVDV